MKEYKLVILNPDIHLNRNKDVADAERTLNETVRGGWELQQIISPNDLGGAMVGVFYREF